MVNGEWTRPVARTNDSLPAQYGFLIPRTDDGSTPREAYAHDAAVRFPYENLGGICATYTATYTENNPVPRDRRSAREAHLPS